MNKLKVIGVSALCGSLAAVSAQAGEMTVKGGAAATYTTKAGLTTGQPIGMASNLTFTGSGELDNGNAFTVNIAHDDQNGYSAADLGVNIAGIGTVTFDQGGGTGLDRLDDKMPTAWEESYDAGAGSNIVTATGVGGGSDIEWAVDSGMLPDGMSAYIAFAPKGSANINDKAVQGDTGGVDMGRGYDIVVEHSGLADGFNLFAGYSAKEQNGTAGKNTDDRKQWVIGGTYAMGALTFGYQTYKDEGIDGIDHYSNDAYGVAFAVNDDFSVSYGIHKSEQDNEIVTTELQTSSLQAAYTMGGASFRVAVSDVDNASYSTAASADYDVNVVSLSLAF